MQKKVSPQSIEAFMDQERLPESFLKIVEQHYQPLAKWALTQMTSGRSFLLGINGAQGSGKSTLAAYIKYYLAQEHKKTVAVLSIDDFYLTHAERQTLAETIHPLLASRGVPGTHDTVMISQYLADLSSLKQGNKLALPLFDKAQDDRAAKSRWHSVNGPVDLILFEGWCVGSCPQQESSLSEPINALEKNEDKSSSWRRYVNGQLRDQYQPIFNRLDKLIFLQVPDFECVHQWRSLQEDKLRGNTDQPANSLMNKKELERFIEYFERLTRHNLETMPEQADVTLRLNADHQVVASIYK